MFGQQHDIHYLSFYKRSTSNLLVVFFDIILYDDLCDTDLICGTKIRLKIIILNIPLPTKRHPVNNEKQIKYDTLYMDVAYRISEMSHCNRRKVGAVVVDSNNIISFGWNGTPAGHCNQCEDDNNITYPTVLHAEHNAIKKIENNPQSGEAITLFVTTIPCLQCAELITKFGIKRVVYEETYRLQDGLDHLLRHGVVVEQITTQKITNNYNKG